MAFDPYADILGAFPSLARPAVRAVDPYADVFDSSTVPATLEEAEDRSIFGDILHGVGRVVGAPKAGVDWLARQGAEALGLPQPEDATTGRILRAGLGLSPGADAAYSDGFAGRGLGRISEFGTDVLTDPTLPVSFGSGTAGRVAAAGFGTLMATGAVEEGRQAYETLLKQGFTPEAAEQLLGTTLSAGGAALSLGHAAFPHEAAAARATPEPFQELLPAPDAVSARPVEAPVPGFEPLQPPAEPDLAALIDQRQRANAARAAAERQAAAAPPPEPDGAKLLEGVPLAAAGPQDLAAAPRPALEAPAATPAPPAPVVVPEAPVLEPASVAAVAPPPAAAPPPATPVATFADFVQQRGGKWPLKSTDPEYTRLKAEFDASRTAPPAATPPPEAPPAPVPPPAAPRYAYRARDVGEQGVPAAGHSQASLSEADVRRIAPSRTEAAQEVVRVDLSKLKPEDYEIIARQPGEAGWVSFKRPLDETELRKVGDIAPADRAAASKAAALPEPQARAIADTVDRALTDDAGAADLAERAGLSLEAARKGAEDVRADGMREFSPEAVAVKRAALQEPPGAVADRFRQAHEAGPDAMVDEYLRQNGNVVDTDAARWLSEDYRGSRDARTRYAGSIHETAAKVTEGAWQRLIRAPLREGQKPEVVMVLGGPGSGKTRSLESASIATKDVRAVLDNSLSNPERLKRQVREALDAGNSVHAVFVHRDPAAAWRGALERANNAADGRMIPVDYQARVHAGALRNMLEIRDAYANEPRVTFDFVDNNGAEGGARIVDPESLRGVNYDRESLARDFRRVLEEERAAGRLAPGVYEAALGSDVSSGAGPGDRRGPREAPERERPASSGAPPAAGERQEVAPPPAPKGRGLPELPKDELGTPILPGQEDWTPERRAAVRAAAMDYAREAYDVAKEPPRPGFFRMQPAVESAANVYGVEPGHYQPAVMSGLHGTPLEGVATPKKIIEALDKDKGNALEKRVLEAVDGDRRAIEYEEHIGEDRKPPDAAEPEGDVDTSFDPEKFRAASAGETSRPLTLKGVREGIPGLDFQERDGSFVAPLKDGGELRVNAVGEIEVRDRAAFEASREASGQRGEALPRGSYRRIGRDSIVSVVEPDSTLDHEAYHFMRDRALNEREKAAAAHRYGDEESEAYAYEKWKGNRTTPNSWFTKVYAFAKRLIHAFRPTWESTFEEIASGRAGKRVAAAAARAETNPSPAQMDAGNYRKGHTRWQGFDVSIETPKGGTRRAKDGSWQVEDYPAHYGYLRRTLGKDGDHVDVFMGDAPESKTVWVVDQQKQSGAFDEHKALIGFPDRETALKAYQDAYEPGLAEKLARDVTEMSVEDFRSWAREGETTKPIAEQASKYATARPGQLGFEGVAEDVPPEKERPKKPEQRDLFSKGEMLQPTEAKVTEGREADGPIFRQEQDARARAEAKSQATIPAADTERAAALERARAGTASAADAELLAGGRTQVNRAQARDVLEEMGLDATSIDRVLRGLPDSSLTSQAVVARGAATVLNKDMGLRYATAPAQPPAPPAPRPRPTAVPPPQRQPGQSFTIPEETRLEAIQRHVQDKFNRVARVQGAVREQGGRVTERTDVATAIDAFGPKVAEKLEDTNRKFVDPLVKSLSTEGPGGPRATLEDLGDYMSLIHAPERDAIISQRTDGQVANGSGWAPAEVSKRWAELEGKYGARGANGKIAALEPRADLVRSMRDEQLRVLRDGGLISAEQEQGWRDAFGENYVPLRHHEAQEGIGSGQGFDIRGKEAQSATGRSTKADNPVVFMLQQLQRSIVRAEKNKVNQRFAELIQDNPDAKLWEIDAVHEKQELGKDGKVKTVRDAMADLQDLGYKVDGEQHRITVRDPLLKRAIENMSAQETGRFLRLAGTATRVYSKLVTTWAPEFLFTNFARDIQTALVNAGAEHGAGAAASIAKNVLPSMKAMYRVTRDPAAQGRLERFAKEFKEDGGSIGFYHLADIPALEKELQGRVKAAGPGWLRGTQRTFNGFRDWVEDANKAVEGGTRLASYVAMREAGATRQKAASVSRNLTVNFGKKGEAGTAVNALYAFANANVQGTKRLIDVLRSPKGAAMAGSIASLGFVMDQFNRTAAGDSDDDGLNDYDAIPEYVKEHNLVFMRGEGQKPLLFPMPYGYNFLHVVGRHASATLSGAEEPTRGGASVGLALVNAFNPLGSEADLVQTLAPTMLDPVVQHEMNRDFTGKPIRPEPFPGSAEKPDSELYFRNVSPLARDIARLLNEGTGGDKVTPGFISVSPETLQHFAQFAGGGLGRFGGNMLDIGRSVTEGETPSIRNVPLARRFVYEASESQQGQKFRENLQELENLHLREKTYRQGRNYGGLEELPRALLRVRGKVQSIENQIRGLRRASASPNTEERIRELMRKANKLVAEAREAS